MRNKKNVFFERNVILSYLTSALMWGRFFIPVLALFYIASQVSLPEFSIIMAVFALSTFLLEIPTGVLADIIGKKKTLILSRLMYVIEVFLIAFFNGFWTFLIAKIISGIGVSLSSGTDSALLYDSLKRMKKEKDYKRVSGVRYYISYISQAIVFTIGSFLFAINYKLPAKLSLIPLVIGLFLTFFLTEPYHNNKKLSLRDSWNHLKEGLRLFWNNPYLKYLAMLTFAISSCVSIMLSISAAFFKEILVPLSIIGLLATVASIISAFSSKQAHKWELKLGENRSLFFVQIAIILSVFGMSLMIPYYGVLFYMIIPLIAGFFGVLISDYANKNVDTSHRATMLSINNMFGNIGSTIIFPLIGLGIKNYSMGNTFFVFGIAIFVYLIGVYLYRKFI